MDALFSQVKDPRVVEFSSETVGFSAGDHRFGTVQILFNFHRRKHGLTDNVPVPDRKTAKNRKPFVGSFLVFNRTADGYVVVAVAPVVGQTGGEPFNTLRQENKVQIVSFLYHFPALAAPFVCFGYQKVRRKAKVNRALLHFVLAVFLFLNGCVKPLGSYNLFGIDTAFCVAFMNITKRTAFAVFVTATPRIPDRHSFHPCSIIHDRKEKSKFFLLFEHTKAQTKTDRRKTTVCSRYLF